MSDELSFKPITSGLGFSTKPSKKIGSGAELAGPVSIAVKKSLTPPQSPFQMQHHPAPVSAAPQSTTIPLVDPVGSLYFLRRFFAFGLDLLVNGVLCITAFLLSAWYSDLPMEALLSTGTIPLFGLFLWVFHSILLLGQEIVLGTTAGKWTFDLEIEGSLGQIISRAFWFQVSFLALGIGLFFGLFRSDRKCLHDLLSGTQPTTVA